MNQYPLWRYILIAIIVILGLIYAAPNLYGDDPAIQVTPKNAVGLPATITNQINDGLKKQNITYLSFVPQKNDSILIRFKDTEDQLKAQDVLQAILGSDYSVALNLAPKTPTWMQAIGAHPMRLGLDLRGGIHFLLEVDVNAMLKERLNSDLHSMANQLRTAMIRYTGISSNPQSGIMINFKDDAARDQAIDYLKKNFSDYQYSKSAQGFSLQAMMAKNTLINLEQDAVAQNITILHNRVNELGVAEPVIQQQGENKISVDLPGIQDTARAKEMIGKVATIRLQLVDTEHDANAAAQSGIVPFGSTLYQFNERPVLLKNQVILYGSSILSAATITDENGRPAVSVRSGGSGVNFFHKVTSDNISKPLAVVYVETQIVREMINGQVVSKQRQVEKVINVASIQSALGNSFQITGLESPLYANNLALLLRSGAYSAPVAFIQERLVGPSLGKENIRMGVMSVVVGSLAVILFMAFYYRLFGLIADVALVLNVILVVALMSILGFTLTLPGIAGIVLTVGIAVDANVLVNERIREELRLGISPQAAIRAGYERAFSTIVDANVTTLIVAVVLFALGTGPVQSFAVTLTLGILLSMVTAIFVTRAIVNLIYGRRNVKSLSIGIRVQEPPTRIKREGVRS